MNNPYEVLGVSQNATMQEIVTAMAKAMRSRKYTMQEITAARVQLSTPEKRLAADLTFPLIDKKEVKILAVPNMAEMDINTFDENKYDSL